MSVVQIKRVYAKPEPGDGYRVLVDRRWPRGVSKEPADLDEWLKDEFTRRYRAELKASAASPTLRRIVADHPQVTLVFAAKDTEHNEAVVLRDLPTD